MFCAPHARAMEVRYFFPAGLQQGTTAAVVAAGDFPEWPVQAWVDRPGLTIEAGEKKGELKVVADASAAPGVYWVRLTGKTQAANLRPLIVGTAPETVEVEPNDEPDRPQPVAAPLAVNGVLSKRGEVDGFAVELSAGQPLAAAVCAHDRLRSPMDAVLQICDENGFVLAQNDDEVGLDPLLAFTAPKTGKYLVRLFAFPAEPDSSISFAGGESFVYRLALSTTGYLDHILPLATPSAGGPEIIAGGPEILAGGWNLPPSGSLQFDRRPASPTAIAWIGGAAGFVEAAATDLPVVLVPPSEQKGAVAAGRLEAPSLASGRIAADQSHVFTFPARTDAPLRFRLESRTLGYPLDGVLQVRDPAGKPLARQDDQQAQLDPLLTFRAPADGDYELVLSDAYEHGGLRYVYRLWAEPVRPTCRATLAADVFECPAGQSIEIPLAIVREDGHAEEVTLQAVELPAQVTCPPVTLAAGDSTKEVKLKLEAAAGASGGPLRFALRLKDGTVRPVMFTIKGFDRSHEAAWLIVR